MLLKFSSSLANTVALLVEVLSHYQLIMDSKYDHVNDSIKSSNFFGTHDHWCE